MEITRDKASFSRARTGCAKQWGAEGEPLRFSPLPPWRPTHCQSRGTSPSRHTAARRERAAADGTARGPRARPTVDAPSGRKALWEGRAAFLASLGAVMSGSCGSWMAVARDARPRGLCRRGRRPAGSELPGPGCVHGGGVAGPQPRCPRSPRRPEADLRRRSRAGNRGDWFECI